MEVEAVIHAVLPQEVTVIPQCHHLQKFRELATKSENWNGNPRLECVKCFTSTFGTPVGVLPWTCRSEGSISKQPDWRAKPPPQVPLLRLGRSEVLRSLRHYLRAQSQVHHTIDRLEERGQERGNARRSSLKGREKAKHWKYFKSKVGENV